MMTADVTGDVSAQLYERDLEVSQRFPGLSGKLLIDAIMRAYCKDNTSKDPFSRCEICKNLGYRLSGRSQRQEHH